MTAIRHAVESLAVAGLSLLAAHSCYLFVTELLAEYDRWREVRR